MPNPAWQWRQAPHRLLFLRLEADKLVVPSARSQYHARLCSYLDKYDKAFIVCADNVGSLQFQNIRKVGATLRAPCIS